MDEFSDDDDELEVLRSTLKTHFRFLWLWRRKLHQRRRYEAFACYEDELRTTLSALRKLKSRVVPWPELERLGLACPSSEEVPHASN